jgi:hypothetical protein
MKKHPNKKRVLRKIKRGKAQRAIFNPVGGRTIMKSVMWFFRRNWRFRVDKRR